jgi:ATP-dependent RNA helicase RhlE
VSLVCVDEHKLLGDIERLLKRDLSRIVIPGYEPDLSIRAEPIQKRSNGRPGGQSTSHHNHKRPAQAKSGNRRPAQPKGKTANRRPAQSSRHG